MNTHDIQLLIDRYLAAETSPDEERQLALALHQAAEGGKPMPDEWHAVLLMLGELTLGEALYDDMLAQRKVTTAAAQNTTIAMSTAKPKRRLRWAWAAAACIALVAGAALIRNQQTPSTQDGALVAQNSPVPEKPDEADGATNTVEADKTVKDEVSTDAVKPIRTTQATGLDKAKRAPKRRSTKNRSNIPIPKAESTPAPSSSLLAMAPGDLAAGSPSPSPSSAPSPSSDPFADFAADTRAIRTRGQQLEAYVSELMNSNENF